MFKLFIALAICIVTQSTYAQEDSNNANKPSSPAAVTIGELHEDVDGNLAHDEYQVISTNGGVTRRPCPYTCEMRGIPKEHCKEWRSNNKSDCYVQDTTKPADVMPK